MGEWFPWKSISNRRLTSGLTLLSIALGVFLLLGVERIREGAKESFEHTLSGTDLIVGARSGSVELLLYSIFHMGTPRNNISWESYQDISKRSEVEWSVPLSLGDSHRGFRVIGTSPDYFQHVQFGNQQHLKMTRGKAFKGIFDVVIGSDVAKKLQYNIGDKLILSHGMSEVSFQQHDDRPFTLVGILEKTNTPIDKVLLVSLAAIEVIHIGWENGAPPVDGSGKLKVEGLSHIEPKEITAFLLKLKSKAYIFSLQRAINDYIEEALSAILPGITFRELWRTLSSADQTLFLISILIILSTLLGMTAAILTSLEERRREVAILRSIGAKPRDIILLFLSEAVFLGFGGCLLGLAMVYAFLFVASPYINQQFGINIPIQSPSMYDLYLLGAITGSSIIAGLIPALRAYKKSLADGLSLRL